MPKPGVRGSQGRDSPRSPSPPARPLAHRATSLPSLGSEPHDAPQRSAEVRRGPSTRGDIAHPAGSGSTSSGAKTAARHSVPVRPANFRPVPSQPPGPATVGRAQQVRAPPPPKPRPSAANKQARPDTQPASADAPPARSAERSVASATGARTGARAACSAAAPARSAAPSARSTAPPARAAAPLARPTAPAASPAPSDAVPPCSDAPPARPAARPDAPPARAVAHPAAPPARSAALPARPGGPATHWDAPSPHPAGPSEPAAATPAHPTLCYKRTVTPQRLWFASNLSPPPPRTSARDSPAAMPGSLPRSGSEMSVASGEYSPIRDQSPPHLEDASDDQVQEDEDVASWTQPERAQRRQRSPDDDDDDDAIIEGECPKRYCVQAPQPSFAEMARRATPQRDSTAATATATANAAAPPKKRLRYPPLVVERMHDWAAHFRVLRDRLGFPPHARPYQAGVRFSPESEEEYRVVQRYLTTLEGESGLSWFAYSLPAERSLKVAIRGLPADTDPADIQEELRELGYQPEYVRHIKARRGRPGCVFHVILKKTPNIRAIYDTAVLLNMRGVKIEAWRGKRGPAQCHRCQQFRHSSHNCHRPLACVRCGEGHHARDCPRPREVPATCANCGGEHPACSIRCPVYREEAQVRRAGTVAITAPLRRLDAPRHTDAERPLEADATTTLMAAANSRTGPRRRRRGGRRRRKPQGTAAPQSQSQTQTQLPEAVPTQEMAPRRRRTTQRAEAVGAQELPPALLAPTRPQPLQQRDAARPPRRRPLPPPADTSDSSDKSRTARAVQILLGVIKALREGARPEEAVLDGLTAVLALYKG